MLFAALCRGSKLGRPGCDGFKDEDGRSILELIVYSWDGSCKLGRDRLGRPDLGRSSSGISRLKRTRVADGEAGDKGDVGVSGARWDECLGSPRLGLPCAAECRPSVDRRCPSLSEGVEAGKRRNAGRGMWTSFCCSSIFSSRSRRASAASGWSGPAMVEEAVCRNP